MARADQDGSPKARPRETGPVATDFPVEPDRPRWDARPRESAPPDRPVWLKHPVDLPADPGARP